MRIDIPDKLVDAVLGSEIGLTTPAEIEVLVIEYLRSFARVNIQSQEEAKALRDAREAIELRMKSLEEPSPEHGRV